MQDAKAPAPAATAPSAPPPVPVSAGDPAAEALEVYAAMWAERVKAFQVASAEDTELERYVASGVLSVFEKELARLKKDGMVIRGALGHEPEATLRDAEAGPPKATVNDCVDLSKWQPLDITTGWPIPLPGNQPVRHEATATLERTDSGRWIVTAYDPAPTRAC
ncbi:hypothetical protein [Streptomyces sp. NPDC049944]|uniref:hypothetical protein n=1 Tax=Streptomyces sp. NPDC049944 TaxID=3155657 RepID=UPI0034366CC5